MNLFVHIKNKILFTQREILIPHGEDLSYRQFCRWFKSAARMIIGNFEKSRVYFEVVSAIVPK